MSRKATDRVTTIGIDIGKNTFHLIGFDARPRRLRVNLRPSPRVPAASVAGGTADGNRKKRKFEFECRLPEVEML